MKYKRVRRYTPFRKKYINFKVSEARRKLKIRAIEYKGGCCQIVGCGYKKSYAALQFHHPDPNEKDFQISGRNITWEKIKPELDKTMLICANCHLELHEKEAQQARTRLLEELEALQAA
jgi:predicted HNH restriction endonuclease